jgi:hypothetical protein
VLEKDPEETIVLFGYIEHCAEQVAAARVGIEKLVPSGDVFILVDDGALGLERMGDRRMLPFLERDGCDWGPPKDGATAIVELERMRAAGASFIVFAWPAFWWLQHYAEFRRYLCSRFACAVHRDELDDINLVVFNLGGEVLDVRREAWPGRFRKLTLIRGLVPERALMTKYRQAVLALGAEGGTGQLGDYLEFGVYIGASLACMHRVTSELGCDHVRLFGFDSFEGLPDSASTEDEGIWEPSAFSCELETTRRFLTDRHVDWDRVFLTKGWFSETLGGATIERHSIRKASIIMIDCDLCSSALEALRFCRPLIRDEAIVFFDDWYSGGLAERSLGERRAFEQFLAEDPAFEVSDFRGYSEHSEAFRLRRKG